MNVAWLPEWSYTHEVWKKIWSPWIYVPQKSNEETIKYIKWNRWAWILPKVNSYWWPVEEVMSNIWKLREVYMLWDYLLKINHILAWIWEILDLTEVHAHPQALMQCASWLKKLWANPELLIKEAYKTPKIYETKEFIIEIEDNVWSLSEILEIIWKHNINIEYLHSAPHWKSKYRFYLLIKDYNLDKMTFRSIKSELDSVWWKIFQEKYNIPDPNNLKIPVPTNIKLVPRNTNVDWIPDALKNPNIWVICSKETARANRLNILKDNICPVDNETHFSIISTLKNVNPDDFKWLVNDKVMWLLTLPDEVWVLAKSLMFIKDIWLSLSFIMSLSNNIWWYDFPLVMERWVNWEILEIQERIKAIWWNLRIM